jgi:outer membrane protein assembly factor BamA
MGIEDSSPRESETRRSQSLAGSVLCLLLVAGACFSFNPACSAQQEQQVEEPQDRTASQTATDSPKTSSQAEQSPPSVPPDTPSDKKKKRGAFVIAPLPISSPAVGSGIVPVVGYIFPFSMKDKVSPPSVIGAAALVTNNGTRGFAVGGQLYLKENRYRITSGFARGNVNYDIYSNGSAGLKLPLNQTGQAFLGEVLRRVGWKFFLGPRFITGRSFLTIRPNSDTSFPIPPDIGLHTTLTAIGAQLTRDSSLNRFYPTGGTYFAFTSDFFSQTLGSKYSFQSYKATFSKYWSLSAKQVLAYNAFLCATGGSPPFYGNCIYGSDNQLRGYIAGEYFTRYQLTTQSEYRLELPKRFGLVVFGGIGEAIPGGRQQLYGSQKFLPSGGGGLRFQLDKKHHVNLRADIAQGRDGHTFGLAIGEAF